LYPETGTTATQEKIKINELKSRKQRSENTSPDNDLNSPVFIEAAGATYSKKNPSLQTFLLIYKSKSNPRNRPWRPIGL
jgi:hypothetical protein